MKKYLNERSMCLHSQSGFTPKEWFTLYTKFQNIEPRLVQIYNFNKKANIIYIMYLQDRWLVDERLIP